MLTVLSVVAALCVRAFGTGWKFKLVLPSILEGARLNVTHLTAQDQDGDMQTARSP